MEQQDSVKINQALCKKYVGRLIETNIFNFKDDEPHSGEVTSLKYYQKEEKIRIQCLLLEVPDSEDDHCRIVLSTPIELAASDKLLAYLLSEENIWLDITLKRAKAEGYFISLSSTQGSWIDVYDIAPVSFYDH